MSNPSSFSVSYRNYGHWDINMQTGRAFAIRVGPGNYFVRDERNDGRPFPRESLTFKTVAACMSYITDLLMFELIVAEGQTPIKIESWNV